MNVGRRDYLKLGAAAGLGAALTGCSQIVRRVTHPNAPDSIALPEGPIDPMVRLVNRVSYGPTPGEIERVSKLGAESYVTEQLYPDDQEPNILAMRVAGLEAFQIQTSELGDLPMEEILRQLQQSAFLHAIYSSHQLRERMVEFWSNHFNIYARKGNGAWFKPADEVQVIRKNALGNFRDLLRDSAHSPAMLQYLDNQVNRRMADGGGANENYARELMELHTLGVHGGYTQKDVQEVARCLTGWTVEDRFLHRKGAFRFDRDRHDEGQKIVLGHRIEPNGGIKDGDQVLEILTKHPSTAKFIAHKVCRYFLGDGADQWTDRVAAIYMKTNGDIKAMLKPLLLSDELMKGPPIMKRPYDYAVSALRALNADTDGGKSLQTQLANMGQPLYQWPMPDGYPDRTAAWTGSLLARWNFALALVHTGIGNTSIDFEGLVKAGKVKNSRDLPDLMLQMLLARKPDDSHIESLHTAMRKHTRPAKPANEETGLAIDAARYAALAMASPEFQWR